MALKDNENSNKTTKEMLRIETQRMHFPIPTLVAQSASAVYTPCKDLVLYIVGERRDAKDLENRISKLIIDMECIKSAKERIDQSLKTSVSTEKSGAYIAMKQEIDVINKNFLKSINKYTRLTNNHLSLTNNPIEMLNDLKSKLMTFNFLKLARLSRDVAKLSSRAKEVADILKSEYMTQDKEMQYQQKLHDDDVNVLPVFDTYVDEILDYLCEDGGNKVGIFGCQGAGKTTVLRKLHNRLLLQSVDEESPGRFDKIMWIDYPLETETEEEGGKIVEILQKEMMEQLGIPHEAVKSKFMNANTISTFLCDKKYVLLMDHVSKYIDLEELGIKQGHKHKKVVVCSEEKKVISLMTEVNVKIRGLEDREALALIQNICGKLEGRRREIAERIIKCCGGIPYVIQSVAIELKGKKDESSWNYVKRCLQSEPISPELIDLGAYAKVYEMKYEGLKADAKKCLLYGALFPLSHKIYTDYLVECWIAEGFIVEESHQKVRANREHGQWILNQLTDVHLLQWYSGKKYITMQPILRRVALKLEKCVNWVPSEDRRPDDATWATVTRMSLIGCRMELPQSPQCCNINTLLLQSLKLQEAQRLPDFFFTHMESLQVLDLNQTDITTLPVSINKLVNLKTLYLKDCIRLVALPDEAARLEKLEFLDISGTLISTLPLVIKSMVNMRCLRASLSAKGGNHKSKGKQVEEFEVIFPPDIISNLRNLEELSIITDFDPQNENWITVAERLATELASLEHLNTLCFNFPNVRILDTFVTQSKALKNKETRWKTHTFQSFNISIGCHETRRAHEPEIPSERWLRHFTGEEELSPSCQELLKQASAFEIICHNGLKSFTSSQFDLDAVEVCVVGRCNYLENIVDGHINSEIQRIVEHSSLKKLYLYDLELLKCIWDGPLTHTHTSLVNLTAITVDGCPKLTKILDHALAHSLQKLEYLKVENCCQISKIIEGCGENSKVVELLKSLKTIELSNLPELECICESTSVSWKSLKSVIVMRCSKLRNLSLTHTNARKRPSIQCEESWWNTLASEDQCLPSVCFFKEESIEAGAQSRREEASTSASGRSEFETATSSMNRVDDYEEEKTHRDDLPLKGVVTEISSLEGDALDDNHDPDKPASSSYVRESREEKKFNKGCFQSFNCSRS